MHMQKGGVQETFLIIPNIFVETMIKKKIWFFDEYNVQMNSIYLKPDFCNIMMS